MFQVEICSQQLEIRTSICTPTSDNISYGGQVKVHIINRPISYKPTFWKRMHISICSHHDVVEITSRNMFPTTRNLQIHMHVYRPRHCCGDWLTFGCFDANDMRVTQNLNSFGEIIAHAHCSVDEKKNIFRVYHIRIIAKKIDSHDMKQTDSSIIIVRNVCVLTKHPWLFNFSFSILKSKIDNPEKLAT
jgi:hypothetical protein